MRYYHSNAITNIGIDSIWIDLPIFRAHPIINLQIFNLTNKQERVMYFLENVIQKT